MEDDMKVETNSKIKGFVSQPVDLDKKDSLQKVLDVIGKLADQDSVKKANAINKSKAVKKIFNKFIKQKASKAETEQLKEIFYDDDDWDEEEDTAETILSTLDDNEFISKKTGKPSAVKKRHAAESQATYIVLTNKRNKIAQVLNDKSSIQKVMRFAKSVGGSKVKEKKGKKIFVVMNGRDDDGIKSEVPLESINSVLEDLEKDSENKIEIKEAEVNQNKIEEADSESDDNETNSKKKKELADFFKQKKQDKFKKMFDIIEQTNDSLSELKIAMESLRAPFAKEVDLSKDSDYFKKSWQALEKQSFRNTEVQISNFLKACYNGANDKDGCDNMGAFLQIASITAALNTNMKAVIKTISAIYKFIDNFNQQWVNIAKFGPSSRFKINQKIVRPKAKVKHKYSDKEWNKMSFFQKYSNTWKFSDSRQNIPKNWFLSFEKKEKESFLNDRAKWRKKRMTELGEKLRKNEKDVINDIDRFMFYENRDGYGFWMPSRDFDACQYTKDENAILDKFRATLKEYSDKKLIYNKFRFGDKFLFCNGLSSEKRLSNYKDNNFYSAQSFYNSYNINSNSQSSFTGKKRKNNNKGYYNENTGYRNQGYNKPKKKQENFVEEE